MPKLDFILQGFMARTHTAALGRVLELPSLDTALISVAYLNDGGVKLVSDKLKIVASKTTAFVGIRNDSTSLQGLQHLLAIGVNLYVVDTGSARLIYHPKLYMASSGKEARLVIGSANFTVGGLNNNIEAGVAMDLDRTNIDDEALLKAISDEFMNLPKNYPEHVLHITKSAQLEKLVTEERLLDETEVEPPKPYVSTGSGSGDKLSRIKLLVKPVKKAVGTKATASKGKPAPKTTKTGGTTVHPTPGAGFQHVWDSTPLTERDLSIPKGTTTNATGSINLDKGLLDPAADHRDYFRNQVFEHLTWKPTSTKTVEEAYANFQLVIKGVNYGDFDLRIGHTTDKSSKAYLQRNAMTRLSWGPIKQYIGDAQFIGRTMSLYRDTSDPTLFLVEID